MPYHIKRSESVDEAVRRMACEELGSAARQLSNPAKGSEGVHEARKSIKKTRALLRLVRDQLNNTYKRENCDLRDIGRKLSPVRDSAALIETFDDLRKKHASRLSKRMLDDVRQVLVAQRKQLEDRAQRERLGPEMAKLLRTAAGRVESWPLKGDGFASLRYGVESVFQAARRSMKRAGNHPTPENYHEWRKRVKDHWYLMRVAENVWPEMMAAERETLHTLEQFLGDDHNLVVLQGKLRTDAAFGDGKRFKPLRQCAAEYQRELREAALALGKRVYDEKPADFVRRTEHLWDLWHAEQSEVKDLLNEHTATVH